MPTISEPRQEAQSWTYARCREAFLKREIGEVTFIVSLQLIGFSPKDAETEVNLARMERREVCPVCMGSGYSNHPDSGEVCHRCKGQGEVS